MAPSPIAKSQSDNCKNFNLVWDSNDADNADDDTDDDTDSTDDDC